MFITTTDRGRVRRLTMSNLDHKNAIPPHGWEELRRALEAFESSDQRVLVVTGAGEEFCSGVDLGGDGSPTVADRVARMKVVGDAARALHRLSKPSIAAVDGVAAGAGMNLALGCDLVVATDRARFSEIFVRRGLSVDFGGTWILPRLVGLQRAKELALSGRMVGAAEALELGLVMMVVTPELLAGEVQQLAESLADGAPVAQALIKRALDRSLESTFEHALAAEHHAQLLCLSTDDVGEGIAAFLEKRPPDFRGR